MLYAAYDVLMSHEQMNELCPHSSVVGNGYIYGYNLVFNGRADIRESDDEYDCVSVVVWDIMSEDWDKLDDYEDCDSVTIEVVFEDASVNIAVVSMSQDDNGICPPDRHYFDHITRAAIENDIDIDYLYDALDYSYENDTRKDD